MDDANLVGERISPQGIPVGFEFNVTEKTFDVSAPAGAVWEWLEDPRTFTAGQVWPYRVEFTPAHKGDQSGFVVGGLNHHHGPGLSAAGELTQIHEGAYRELVYFYGSYVGSFRFARPCRLEFWVEEHGDQTRVRMRFESWIRKSLAGLWARALDIFWARFGRWMGHAVIRRSQQR